MIDHLVIGGNGLIGTALCEELERRNLTFICTTRRSSESLGPKFMFRLGHDEPAELPDAGIVYLVAATPGFAACEGNAESWVVNVDAQIAIARRFKATAFIVYVSSDSVEWGGVTAYARQKAQVEAYIQAIDGAIVRPSRVVPAMAPDFAKLMVDVGLRRQQGVTRWKAPTGTAP